VSVVSVFGIAVGLAMDAFAVSVASGAVIKRRRLHNAARFGLFFGGFQMAMPVIGWVLGVNFRKFVGGVDHWVAFGLLAFIGFRMIYNSFKIDGPKADCTFGPERMVLLSIATSIDALAVGISFAFLDISIAAPVAIIGAVAFIFSFAGVLIGASAGNFFENKLEAAGGIILIVIGIKILLEHLC
jgi:putative Mn2+ efflux pump MntP